MWRKNKAILEKIRNYLKVSRSTVERFFEGLCHCIEHGRDTRFARFVDETHQLESDADTVRREIELTLFRKSLLPESREDIMLLLERFDEIPNQAEEILRTIQMEHLDLPPSVHEWVMELAKLGCETLSQASEAVENALQSADRVTELTREIDGKESVGDHLEQKAVSEIFDSGAEIAVKILHRDLILKVGRLCDLAEDVAYFLKVFVAKRRI